MGHISISGSLFKVINEVYSFLRLWHSVVKALLCCFWAAFTIPLLMLMWYLDVCRINRIIRVTSRFGEEMTENRVKAPARSDAWNSFPSKASFLFEYVLEEYKSISRLCWWRRLACLSSFHYLVYLWKQNWTIPGKRNTITLHTDTLLIDKLIKAVFLYIDCQLVKYIH